MGNIILPLIFSFPLCIIPPYDSEYASAPQQRDFDFDAGYAQSAQGAWGGQHRAERVREGRAARYL